MKNNLQFTHTHFNHPRKEGRELVVTFDQVEDWILVRVTDERDFVEPSDLFASK